MLGQAILEAIQLNNFYEFSGQNCTSFKIRKIHYDISNLLLLHIKYNSLQLEAPTINIDRVQNSSAKTILYHTGLVAIKFLYSCYTFMH